MYIFNDDGSVDVEGTYKRAQYDNGSAAGSPPDFDGPTYGEKPAPYVAPTATRLPRLGQPILVAGPGITPNAPKSDEGTPMVPGASKVAPSPLSAPAMPVLRAADTPQTSGPMASRVDWRYVAAGTLGLLLVWWLVSDDDGRDA